MTRTEIGKRVIVYGGTIKLRCPRCRAEKLPEEYYRSGSNDRPLHCAALCKVCFNKAQAIINKRRPSTGRPVGRPRTVRCIGLATEERVSVPEARIRAARLARGLDMDTGAARNGGLDTPDASVLQVKT